MNEEQHPHDAAILKALGAIRLARGWVPEVAPEDAEECRRLCPEYARIFDPPRDDVSSDGVLLMSGRRWRGLFEELLWMMKGLQTEPHGPEVTKELASARSALEAVMETLTGG